jgi:hypothetical protein
MVKKILSALIILLFLNPLFAADEKGVWSHKKISNEVCALYQFPVAEKAITIKEARLFFLLLKKIE